MKLRKLLSVVVVRTPLPEMLFRSRSRKAITVLAYHRILPLPGANYPFDENVISATPEEFDRELRFFRRHLDVISVPELMAGYEDPGRLPTRPAVITFDDGYADNYEIAMPILRQHGLSACFFLSTQLVGTAEVPWWDQVACCMKFARVEAIPSPFGGDDPPYNLDASRKAASIRRFLQQMYRAPWPKAQESIARLREQTGVDPREHADRPLFMSWEAARAMQAAGMELGGHTRTHPIVANLPDREAVRDEIQGCYDDLRDQAGVRPVAFAYPVGSRSGMSAIAEEEIRRAGFKAAFSYVHSFATLKSPVLKIPRVQSEYGHDHNAFRLGMALTPICVGEG
jgi:peptidoglycan/xylan/chitin deacetylase (PgdA/CDA1 family)